MARTQKNTVVQNVPNGQAATPAPKPKSAQIASRGICDASDANTFLSALIGDVMNEAVPEKRANSAISGIARMCKVVELNHKYGNPQENSDLSFTAKPRKLDEKCERRAALIRELNELDAVTN